MRVGPGHPRMDYSLSISFVFSFAYFSGGYWGEGEMEAPLGRYGSSWVVAGDAGRGWDQGKMYIKNRQLP